MELKYTKMVFQLFNELPIRLRYSSHVKILFMRSITLVRVTASDTFACVQKRYAEVKKERVEKLARYSFLVCLAHSLNALRHLGDVNCDYKCKHRISDCMHAYFDYGRAGYDATLS